MTGENHMILSSFYFTPPPAYRNNPRHSVRNRPAFQEYDTDPELLSHQVHSPKDHGENKFVRKSKLYPPTVDTYTPTADT